MAIRAAHGQGVANVPNALGMRLMAGNQGLTAR
jgi:hypothetical protein